MTQKLIEYLRDEIKAITDARNESLRWFVQQVGLDYSAVYRMTNGEQKHRVSFYHAYKLLKYLKPDSFVNILNDYFPEDVREFFPNGQASESLDTAEVDRERIFRIVFQERNLYEVGLAVECANWTLQEIVQEFGSRGTEAVEALQELKVLKICQSGQIEVLLKGLIVADETLIKQQVHTNTEVIHLKRPGTNVFSNTAGLNSKGVAAVHSQTLDYKKKLSQILANEEFKGSIPFVISSVIGPLTESKERK